MHLSNFIYSDHLKNAHGDRETKCIDYLLSSVNTDLHKKHSQRCTKPAHYPIDVLLAIRTEVLWKWAVPKKMLAQFQIKYIVVRLKSACKASCIIRMFKY